MTLLALVSFVAGIVMAIPLGPANLELIKRALGGDARSAVALGIGAAIGDLVYCALAYYGLAPWLTEPAVEEFVAGVGAAIVLGLGVYGLYETRRDVEVVFYEVRSKARWAVVTGLTLSLTNPLMLLWCGGLIGLFGRMGYLPVSHHARHGLEFAGGFGLGTAGYFIGLAFLIYELRTRWNPGILKRIQRITAWCLVGLSIVIGLRAVIE